MLKSSSTTCWWRSQVLLILVRWWSTIANFSYLALDFLLSTALNVAVVPQLTFKQEKLSLADYKVWLVDVPPDVFSVVLGSFIFIHQYSLLGMFLQKKIHKKITRKWRWRSPIIQTCSPFLQLSFESITSNKICWLLWLALNWDTNYENPADIINRDK